MYNLYSVTIRVNDGRRFQLDTIVARNNSHALTKALEELFVRQGIVREDMLTHNIYMKQRGYA